MSGRHRKAPSLVAVFVTIVAAVVVGAYCWQLLLGDPPRNKTVNYPKSWPSDFPGPMPTHTIQVPTEVEPPKLLAREGEPVFYAPAGGKGTECTLVEWSDLKESALIKCPGNEPFEVLTVYLVRAP